MSQKTSPRLKGLRQFLKQVSYGNWQFRWSHVPYFDTAKTGKTESIVAHEWGCIIFWLGLRRVCPNLDAVVDSTKIYEILTIHDLGETYRGDISAVSQLNGQGVNKHLVERREILKITKSLGNDSSREIITLFDKFESELGKITELEVLVANFIDSLQGNHFVLDFGHDLQAHSETINKIINKYEVPQFKRLIDRLLELGHQKAAEEVRGVISNHVDEIKGMGIKLDTTNFGGLLISKETQSKF